MTAIWEAYAIRFATMSARRASQVFLGGLPADMTEDAIWPFNFYVWCLKGPAGTIVIDTGASTATAAKRGFPLLRTVEEGLRAIGTDPGKVGTVLLTHLHWDHAGNPALFSSAQFHMHRHEMAYVTGPAMRHPFLRGGYDAEEIGAIVRLVHERRLTLHGSKTVALADGVIAHHVGGHTAGQMLVRVNTRRGWMVIANDSVAFREGRRRGLPFPNVYNVADALDAFDTARSLADAEDLVIPGHDPWVLAAHPPAAPGLDGIAHRLD